MIATNVIEKVNCIVGSIFSSHHFGEPVEKAHAMKYVKIAKVGKNNIILRPKLMICLSMARKIASQSLTVAFSPIGEMAFILEKRPLASSTPSSEEDCIVSSPPSIAIGKGCYFLSLSGIK